MKTLVKNAADKEQVESAERKERYGRKVQLADLRQILATDYGRRFIWRYLEECHVFGSVFNNSGSITYFNEGRRDVGRVLLADVTEANDEALIQMMRESKDRDRKADPEGE